MASAFKDRLPFAEAIADDKLLGKAWKRLSLPQQVILKAAYGLPLTDEELVLWSAFQGAGRYDQLGYLTGITEFVPYRPKEYDIVTGVIGRRSGKSTEVGGFAGAYEITLGGHMREVTEGQDAFFLYIAQDLDTAIINMKAIKIHLDQSPLLAREITRWNQDIGVFRNGITLKAEPPSLKTSRGSAVVGIIMDEVGFWYKDSRAANPDYEVIRAVDYAMAQFTHAKQFRFSTPWSQEGVLYEDFLAGTEGCNLKDEDERAEREGHLVIHAPTATMGNPRMTRKRLVALQKRDPEAFERESLAQFTGVIGAFLPEGLIAMAVKRGEHGPRPPNPKLSYVASMDPAFRHDDFAFQVWHHRPEDNKIVQDVARHWEPLPGQRLNPAVILDEIVPILQTYGLMEVYSDQYQLESLQALAEDRGFSIIGVDFTARSKVKILGTFASVLKQLKLEMLDDADQEVQLKNLQKITQPSGIISITAPNGKKDDKAMCAALGVHQTLFYLNPAETTVSSDPRESLRQELLARVREKWARGEVSEHEELQARMSEAMNILFMNQEEDSGVVA